MTDRELNAVQYDRLDTISIRYPNATVVGWHKKDSDGRYGPIIKFDEKVTKFVNHSGRLINGR